MFESPDNLFFPAGPKAPAPVAPNFCVHWQHSVSERADLNGLWRCECGICATYAFPSSIVGAALRARNPFNVLLIGSAYYVAD